MTENFIRLAGDKLAAALKLCATVIERRNTYPILGMVRLVVDESGIELSATDLDIVLTIPLAGRDGAGKWSICLPVRALETVARLGRDGDIVVSPKGEDRATVALDQGDLFQSVSYEIEGLGVDSFPEINGERGAAIERFGNGRIVDLVGKVAWAASFEETRYYLNGVAWEIGKHGRRFIATDGHRLATCRYDAVGLDGATQMRVLPNKLVALLRQLGGRDMVLHGVQRNGACVDVICADGITLRAKTVDLPGTGYPDVDRVIPRREQFKAAISVTADAALAALSRAMAFVGRHTGKVIRFDGTESGTLRLSSTAIDVGKADVVLQAEWPAVASPFGVNGAYLKTVLGHCAGTVVLHQVDATAPLTILDDDETVTRLLMPVRV